jgi:hypothetical protein
MADGYHGRSVGVMEKAGVPTTQHVVIAKTEVPALPDITERVCKYQRRQKSLALPDIAETVCEYQRRQKSLALPAQRRDTGKYFNKEQTSGNTPL